MIKKLVRKAIAKLGYTYSIVPLTPDEKSKKPVDLIAKVCAERSVPFCATLNSADQYSEVPALLPARTAAILPESPLQHYAGLDDALIDNKSMSLYFKVERQGTDILMTDGMPNHSYVLRQRRIAAACGDVLGTSSLSGMRVLDVGCSCGYFSFAASRMGAREVLGIDGRPEHADQFAILQATLPDVGNCRFHLMDMENDMERLEGPYDVVFAMGVLYHTFDHVRFMRNMSRLTGKLLYLMGDCSGRADMLCEARIENPGHLRQSIHGPVLYPSLPWTIELLRYVGFKQVFYQRPPTFIGGKTSADTLYHATLVAVK